MQTSYQPHVSPSNTVIHGNIYESRTSDCEARSLTVSREARHFRLMKTKIESVIKATAALSARKLNVCSLDSEQIRTSVNMRVGGALPNTFDIRDARRLCCITGSR